MTLIALTFPYLFSGCATIVSKTTYPVTIHSRPSGANFAITDKKGNEVFKGQTPATVKLRSGGGYFARADYKVKISSPGFEEQILPISYKTNGQLINDKTCVMVQECEYDLISALLLKEYFDSFT